MEEPVHIAITRKVVPSKIDEFESVLSDFVRRSVTEHGWRGVHVLYPPKGSVSTEYGILRSFASEADRDAFYETPLYQEWLRRIEPLVEGPPRYRRLSGLEAWFRGTTASGATPPPRWKMAVLTWLAVWPVSMLVASLVGPVLGPRLPHVLTAGAIAGGIVIVLTWAAMPILVKLAAGWLHR